MRFGHQCLMEGMRAQERAYIELAKATAAQRRAVGIQQAGLQLIHAAVARTPSSRVHPLFESAFQSLAPLGIRFPRKVMNLAEARQELGSFLADLGRVNRNASNVQASTSGAPSVSVPTVEQTVRASAEEGGSVETTAEADDTLGGVNPDQGGVQRTRRLVKSPKKHKLDFDLPSYTTMGPNGQPLVTQVPARERTELKKGKTRYFDCPWPDCEAWHAKPTSSRQTINGHICEVHTYEVLLCPMGDNCRAFEKLQRPHCAFNAQSLSKHYWACRSAFEQAQQE